MTLRLRDTASGELHDLPAREALSLYVCGITPYDATHLGHAFTYVQFDALVRTAEWLGRRVKYVQNVTDIDDSILARARQVDVDWRELGDAELERYETDMRVLHVRPPSRLVRATAVIPAIQELSQALVERGAAYPTEGGTVFFRVRADPTYGSVSHLDRDAMLEISARQDDADLDDPRKEDPLDVALWKGWSGDPGEPRWESRWGPGRPGWHIECATIIDRHLGPQIDFHGGGADLVYPHHETEAAIMETATDRRPFVGTWVHTGMVGYEGEKMSKSLGNLVFVEDLSRRFEPDAIRLYLLGHHYRMPFEYTEDGMLAAAERSAALRARLREPDSGGADARAEFRTCLEDDLDVPAALAALDGTAGSTARELAGVLGLFEDTAA